MRRIPCPRAYLILLQLFIACGEAWVSSTRQQRHIRCRLLRLTTENNSEDNAVVVVQNRDNDERKQQRLAAFLETSIPGPDIATKPDYENIHGPLGPWMDFIFQEVFRSQLADVVGMNSTTASGFPAILELAACMNQIFPPAVVHSKARTVLNRLFPSWMPSSYAVLFSKPFPEFSARMNAWATSVAGVWLMGECEINDVEMEDEKGNTVVYKDQGLLVKRCRFLEESGCASVCVNSCKIPTQNFFINDMGLPLTMEPDYETFECQFSFGKMPTEATESEAKSTPCLGRCPTAGALRARHNPLLGSATESASSAAKPSCSMMGDE